MESSGASVLPASLAMGHQCATDTGREDTGAPTHFLGTKNAWDGSWRPIFLTITANLGDNAGSWGDARLIKE